MKKSKLLSIITMLVLITVLFTPAVMAETNEITGNISDFAANKAIYFTVEKAEGINAMDVYLNASNMEAEEELTSAQVELNIVKDGLEIENIEIIGNYVRLDDPSFVGLHIDTAQIGNGVKTVAGENKIKLFTVNFTGVGDATVSIKQNNLNKAVFGTTETAETYQDSNAYLKIEQELATITAEINLSYPICDQIIDYTNMALEITSDGKTVTTFDLGSNTAATGSVIFNNSTCNYTVTTAKTGALVDKYTVTISLPKNLKYKVSLTGDGYRKAFLTLMLDGNKTVVAATNGLDKINAEQLAVDLKFVAGEIIADGKINIYDLSAVASYFNPTAENIDTAKIKYDLNRDKYIDVTDIAYLIRNWGK